VAKRFPNDLTVLDVHGSPSAWPGIGMRCAIGEHTALRAFRILCEHFGEGEIFFPCLTETFGS
jgi:hypothetical protein